MLENAYFNSLNSWNSWETVTAFLQEESNQEAIFGTGVITATVAAAFFASKYISFYNPLNSKLVKRMYHGMLLSLLIPTGFAQNYLAGGDLGSHALMPHNDSSIYFRNEPLTWTADVDIRELPVLDKENAVLSKIFPLNSKKDLRVDIPKSFKEAFTHDQGILTFTGFIPQNEDLENWNELITIYHISQFPSNIDFMQEHQKKNLELTEDLKIDLSKKILRKYDKPIIKNGLRIGVLGEDRTSVFFTKDGQMDQVKEGINEIYRVQSYQTNQEVYYVEYAIRYDTSKKSERKKAIKKTENFMHKNLELKETEKFHSY
ncbi:MAG: hypothetical protein K1000chlam3_00303 [Chlamydiae bacterium]|nr:hypothetical protein [Chlamydiota bacterium]